MSDLPGVEFPEEPAHPLLVHEPTNWKPALVVAAILDTVGLAALYYAFSVGTVEELATGASMPKQWVFRILLGGVVAQLAAIPVARRTRFPWAVTAWAGLFVVMAVFTAVAALAGVMSIQSVID